MSLRPSRPDIICSTKYLGEPVWPVQTPKPRSVMHATVESPSAAILPAEQDSASREKSLVDMGSSCRWGRNTNKRERSGDCALEGTHVETWGESSTSLSKVNVDEY